MFRPHHAKSSGFILLELIIVLFLMSVIMGLAALFFANTLPGHRLNATARNISTTIKQARAYAKIENEPQVVMLDLENRQFGLEGRTLRDIPSDVGIKIIDPVEGELVDGKYRIIVHRTGGVEGGSIVLWNKKRTITIQLDPIIGAIRVQ